MNANASPPPPLILVSVIILNYNGAQWLERCLASLRAQTLFPQIEVILADNLSTDGSDRLAEEWMRAWPNGRFIQHGANLGYCEGNNRAAQHAGGQYLFFLNNDTWLEPGCLQSLLQEVQRSGAKAATPLVLNYADDSFQSLGAAGFDIFGLASARFQFAETREVFMPEGCSFLIERFVFEELGGFDRELFMYSDELDLSWRLWLAGYRAIAAPSARLHHRGAANVNPKGGGAIVEIRTSDTKRFYANRNGLLVVLKNAQHLCLLMVPLQLLLLFAEALAGLLLIRRLGFIRRAYWQALADAWALRHHILRERRRVQKLRRRGDWWMLRFLQLRWNRWDELLRLVRFGKPKVTAS